MTLRTCSIALALAAATLGVNAAAAQSAKAMLKSADGKDVGSAELRQTSAGVLITLSLKGIAPGEHAFHFHEIGKCEPPFTSAKGHFNPDKNKHGLMADEGAHAGDMPNLHVPASGELTIEILNEAVTLQKGETNSLLDDDGSAVVIHAKADDYKSDPAGEAGDRIVCGVVQ